MALEQQESRRDNPRNVRAGIQNKKEEIMKLLKVQGKGSASVAPDRVVLSFDIRAKKRDYGACVENLNHRTAILRKNVAAVIGDEETLKTTDFQVGTDTKYDGGHYIFIGYKAAHSLMVEVPMDTDLLNRVLHAIAKGESGAEIDLTFTVSDQDGLKKRVLENAVHKAKTNAQILADAAGVKLGALQQIDYGWSEVHIMEESANMICEMPDMDMYSKPDITPDDVSAKDSVTLVYAIE
ncbi:MAG: DUF541 domain-containing protein [Spartobacteria bacterium]|nr:DUF541 domain-containing protein [Spartobacteria bacterium]